MPIKTFKIPYLLTKDSKSKHKAQIVYIKTRRADESFTMTTPESCAIATVIANSAEAAYDWLIREVKPFDGRPIWGKWAIRFFVLGDFVVGRDDMCRDFEELVDEVLT